MAKHDPDPARQDDPTTTDLPPPTDRVGQGLSGAVAAQRLAQEGQAEHAIEALRDLTSPLALVIHDGQAQRSASRRATSCAATVSH
jgi:hypothetical protein